MDFSLSLDLTSRVTLWNTIASVFLMWTCHVSFHQNCAQRLISLPSLAKAKQFDILFLFMTFHKILPTYKELNIFRAMIVFTIGVMLIMGLNSATGIIMYSYYHGCDPVKAKMVTTYDKLMPRFVQVNRSKFWLQ